MKEIKLSANEKQLCAGSRLGDTRYLRMQRQRMGIKLVRLVKIVYEEDKAPDHHPHPGNLSGLIL
jgi:hypothetical protein